MDELKNIAPELAKIGKKNAFSVPDNYFEDLPSKIQERVTLSKKHSNLIFNLLKKPAFALSFSLILIILIAVPLYISHFQRQVQQNQIAYQDIEISDIDYFDISEDMLIEEISTDNLKIIQLQNEENEDAVMDYIIDNVDYSTILDEL